MIGKTCMLAILGAVMLVGASHPQAQQQQRVAAPSHPAALPETPVGVRTLTGTDLDSWLDGYMSGVLKQGKIAGAQVVVVKDGRVLLERGYGYADIANKTAMDPGRHQMRIGSTSKLFAWTAVMQLVEAGKIDLNADINRYLDFRISPPGGRPLTMNHLMTHRGGFEEGLKDLLATDPRRLKTTERYLKENVRPFMFAPGEVPSYSNYGTALAGYIVQRVSGLPYDDYVERHILNPLRMTRSTSRQPLPPAFAASLSKGYRSTDTAASPIELAATAPAGDLSATGSDMANFMIAHLQEGRFGEASILRPATSRLMHASTLQAPAGFDTLAHGFFRGERNGRVVLGHGGDTIVFHSDLNLLPQEGVGIFVSFNSRGENDAVYPVRERLFEQFLNRYFPAPVAATPPAIATAAQDGLKIAGHYESSRRVETGFISLFYLLQQDQIIPNEDGTVSLSSVAGKRFREISPNLWREVGGWQQLLVSEAQGRRAIVDSNNPIAILQAAPIGRNAAVFQLVAGSAVFILLATVLIWPITAWIRRSPQIAPVATGRAALARRLTRIGALADLIYLGGWYAIVAPILQIDVGFYNAGIDGWIRFLQVASIVPLSAAIIGVWNAWLALKLPHGRAVRLRAVIVALGLLGFLWTAWVGGFIGWSLNY